MDIRSTAPSQAVGPEAFGKVVEREYLCSVINKRERFKHQIRWNDMKRRRRRLFLIFLVMICGACQGCGNAVKEAGAEYVSQELPGDEGDEAAEGTGDAGTDAGTTGADAAGTATENADADAAEESENGEDSADADKGGSAEDGDAVSSNSVQAEDPARKSAGPGQEETGTPRRDPVKVRGIYVSGPVAGISRMDELIELVDQTELNAIVIDIKNDEGRVTYDMQSRQVLETESGIRYIPDLAALITKCKEKDIYLIARIVAFRDPYLAEKKPEWAVHTKEGEIFRDKSGLAWVNPYCREVWDYLVEIAGEAAAAGFDEVQFDYIRFSTDIKADTVDYGPEAGKVGKIEIITEFTEYLYEKLAPLGVYVAADVFGTVIENETDQEIVGQEYVKMAEHLDYICPMIYPSHYRNGSYGIRVPDAEPYETIYNACSASVQELSVLPEGNRAHVRAWLQGFTASSVPGHISYGPRQIREQIKGAYDAGYEEWILWNAAVRYQRDAFLTEEEAEAERMQWEAEKQQKEKNMIRNTEQKARIQEESYVRNAIFVRNSHRESGGYDTARDRNAPQCGSDRRGGYTQQREIAQSFRNQNFYDQLP